MLGRVIDLGRITSERLILQNCLAKGVDLNTIVSEVQVGPQEPNTVGEDALGLFRSRDSRKAVIADIETLRAFGKAKLTVPSFLEAGPRAELCFNRYSVRAAIVTTGGLAPGLHCVIHSIVKRHCDTYSIGQARGRVFGVYSSFQGRLRNPENRTARP